MDGSTLSSSTFKMALLAYERLGHDAEAVLKESEIAREEVDRLWARIPIDKERRFWRAAVARTGDSRLALKMSAAVPFGTFPLLEYVGASCRTNLVALQLLARYSKIVYGRWDPEIEEREDRVEYRLGASGDPEEVRQTTEFGLGVLWDRLESSSSEPVPLVAAHFRHAAGGDAAEYARRFGAGCALQFEQPEDMLVFSPRIRDVPCRNANPIALGSLLHAVNAMFAKLQSGSRGDAELLTRIKATISEEIAAGEVDADSVAKRLGLSKRTLQRRLAAGGRSLRALTAETRRDQALKLLAEPARTVEEIGLLVGYSDLKAFNRAFQSWFGMTPSTFRRNKLNQ